MNQAKKYNRIKYVGAQHQFEQQQDDEGLFDIFKTTGKKITSLATSKFSKKVAKKLLQQVLKSLLCLVRKFLAKVLQTKL